MFGGCRCHSPGDPLNKFETVELGVPKFSIREKDYQVEFPSNKIIRSPAWSTTGSGENPRILPGKAVALARVVLAKKFSDASNWSVSLVSLNAWPGFTVHGSTDRWYYEVNFMQPEPPFELFYVVVLLDGSLFEPREIERVK